MFWLCFHVATRPACERHALWDEKLHRSDYEKIVRHRSFFGDFDPFGDFDLLFGASKQHLKIVDVPIRYRDRQYGSTNIQRWRHGVLLLQMIFFAARKIKFV